MIPTDELIADLQQIAAEHGEPLSSTTYKEYGSHDLLTVTNRFGSWDEALIEAGLEKNTVSNDDIIADLQKVAANQGEPLDFRTYREHGICDPVTVERRFGSWNEGLIEAGIKTNTITNDDLITDLQKVAADHGEPLTIATYDEYGSYSQGAVYDRFKSWDAALQEAGIRSNEATADEVVADLQQTAAEHGEPLTGSTYEEYGSYSVSTVRNRFGSWSEGLIEAGLETDAISTDDLIADLQRVAADHGEPLASRTYDEYGVRSSEAVKRHFGSWNEGLIEAGIETNTQPDSPDDSQLIADMKETAADNGGSLTFQEYKKYGSYSPALADLRFGSWNDGLIEAGIGINNPYDISTDDLIADLQQTADEHGEPLSSATYDEYGSHTSTTVHNHFESWTEGLIEAGVEIAQIRESKPIDVLNDIREVTEGEYGTSLERYTSEGSWSGQPIATHFDTWWKAVVCAGLLPAQKRPLTPKQFDEYYREVTDLSPVDALPPLLFMFSGMSPRTAYRLSPDWLQEKRDKNIIKVPAEVTNGDPWIVRLPETWVNPHTGNRIQTKLPELVEWVLDQYGCMPYSDHSIIRNKCFQAAESVNMESRQHVSRRHDRRFSQVVPLIRPSDLSYTHAANLVRQDIDSSVIERRLGAEGYRDRFFLDEVMTWVYVQNSHIHPEFEPPPVAIDPDFGDVKMVGQ
jgi:hypothetical protein